MVVFDVIYNKYKSNNKSASQNRRNDYYDNHSSFVKYKVLHCLLIMFSAGNLHLAY